MSFTLARWYAEQSADPGPLAARIAAFVAPSAAQIWDGAYYGLLTTFFAHGDWMHLLFNMLWLIQLGRVMEGSLSPWAYFLFLFSSAALSAGSELAVTGHAGIGASGVVYAMFGLMWVGRARYRGWSEVATRQNLNIFIIWGMFCVFATYAGFMHVANVAHGSGILFGLSVGWLFLAPQRRMVFVAPIAVMILLTLLSLFWLPWTAEWNYYRASNAFTVGDYRAAIDWYHRSLRLGGERYISWENIKRAWGNLANEARKNKDRAAYDEAQKQVASAGRLEGPDPSLAQEHTSGTGFTESKPGR